ncbi:aspartyl-tRNA(Asn)/glutamyl-tRNA(Gln) amidotransferase subunit A [Methanomicrobium sp. W14]|uniref:Asp-tRNA(Asn)/Glu-tRNA(Gln) amidotransferase subunit GatA n=1 Tax=Methanomicrobium sp. W14 TaxID=2817839 RepID=UPI001AEA6546|nr:Asp-tRNA(Asn)/Glu-tRNA(Gln) amidotransferase subunit GatA [Methanomicrobium sp. W14]MBP2132938.1 aspartyl-tRNA(Asn)/glutamyl-tRNA(Gln) amidotransferase subunit A [Methanomicrobium sp. W14]
MAEYTFDAKDENNAFISIIKSSEYGDGKLSGIPVAVKDNISTKGIETTCGSNILRGYVPPFDAHVVTLLKNEGAAVVGKTNMDEFGMGTTTESSAYGITTNPCDKSRVTGGSSGGSAAAIASGMVPMALGTDTGGSIRCPASFCGIVGLKPTYGRISRYGLIAYSNSLEQIGPMAANVTDVSKLFEVISKPDGHDATAYSRPYEHVPSPEIKGKKIGIPKEYFGEGVDEKISECVKNAISRMEGLGAEIVECSIPSMSYALAAYYVICTSEASSNLSRFDGVRYGPALDAKRSWHDEFRDYRGKYFGEEVIRRILLGTFALSAGYYGKYYAKAKIAKENIKKDFLRVLKEVDLIAGPTMPNIAYKIGEKSNPLEMYLSDILTVPANLAGVPAISVPCGKVEKMPVGLQIIGRHFDEETVIDAAFAFEQEGM